MKKHILIAVSSLALSSSLGAFQKENSGECFRPAFQKKLKRVSSVKGGSFRSLSLKKKVRKKEVFIDWRKLYWGNLKDLIYSEEETCTDDIQDIAGSEERNVASIDTEDALAFATELRQELKSFARQYSLKIVWRKKSLDLIDGTSAFLEYWDKGYSQGDRESIPLFEKLCPLSVKATSIRDTSIRDTSIRDTSAKERAAKVTTVKAADTQPQFKGISYANPYIKKGA